MLSRLCIAGAVALFMMVTSAWAVQKPHRLAELDAGVYLASEFDAAATYHLLQNCGSRRYEGNPMVRPFARNPSVFVVLGASAYAVNYLARKLQNRGHRRWATALRVLAIGVHAGAGAQALALDH
jgi:hypothetical protein